MSRDPFIGADVLVVWERFQFPVMWPVVVAEDRLAIAVLELEGIQRPRGVTVRDVNGQRHIEVVTVLVPEADFRIRREIIFGDGGARPFHEGAP